MHGLIYFFKLFLKINTRLAQKIKLPTPTEMDLHGGLPPASTEQCLNNQNLGQKHISQRTLRRLRLKGMISYIQVNGKYYYRKSDIEKLKD
ncbi:MAG: hypothetical protein B7Y24_17450 [Sphingobacteriales bacterium 16-39-50]|nr:MAG: hypothetical protein B7Y24_17450 [Sphingobacteriales bacterium 16-39-50]